MREARMDTPTRKARAELESQGLTRELIDKVTDSKLERQEQKRHT